MIIVKSNKIIPGEEEKKFMGEPLPIRFMNRMFNFFGSLGPPNNGKGSFM